ncbi:MAG TPA: intradiol ring-cleavage dioxygenase [Acidimicrobiia bacterium]
MSEQISRRRALGAVGAAGLGAVLTACSRGGGGTGGQSTATSSSTTTRAGGGAAAAGPVTAELFDTATACTLAPEMTEGPYYFDVDSIRTDVREDREGAALRLGVRVRDASSCTPVSDAVVDIWHCDALGLYSGFEAASTGTGGGGGAGPTDDETYLRGAQITNGDGIAEFVTVYPGWYRGRTVHIHAKVHLDKSTMLTTQLFFDDGFTERIYAREPYASDTGRDTFNDDDGIFDDALLLTLSERGDETLGLITLDVAAG